MKIAVPCLLIAAILLAALHFLHHSQPPLSAAATAQLSSAMNTLESLPAEADPSICSGQVATAACVEAADRNVASRFQTAASTLRAIAANAHGSCRTLIGDVAAGISGVVPSYQEGDNNARPPAVIALQAQMSDACHLPAAAVHG